MSSLAELTGKDYLSYSSFSSYNTCSEQFRLERVVGLHSPRNWAMVAGNVIHTATELLDNGDLEHEGEAVEAAWALHLADLDTTQLRVTGKVTKATPNRKDEAYWRSVVPLHVARWRDWVAERYAEGWELLGIELDVTPDIGDVKLKGYVDRLFVDNHGQVRVVDLKSGERAPDVFQLGIYKAALEASGHPVPVMGAYFMTRNGECDWHMLDRFTVPFVNEILGTVRRGIESEVFIPKPNIFCDSCGVRAHCRLFGDRA